MASGAPVVMTDSRGVREYALPDVNCLLTPPHNPQALADAIIKVLEDPLLASRLRENGPPTAGKFTWDSAVDRFEAALNQLCA
jgi:glycosyltransferase involved in cell wall biosynthesis